MARIRTLKPEFWGDEKLSPQSPIVRLVFLGLISMADDAGRLLDNVKAIDGFIFPESEETSRDPLDTLASSGRIVRYTSESGQRLIQVANWLRHQKVDKPSRYVLPGPVEVSRESRDGLDESSRSDLGPTTYDLGPTTDDQRPPTAATRERQVLGVNGQPLIEARNELVNLLGAGTSVERVVDDFLAASPPATRFAWARGLIGMLEPTGGPAVAVDVLIVAMQDFLVADRAQWPFAGRVFRAFVDDAKRPRGATQQRSGTGDVGAEVFAKIRLLVKSNPDPRQGVTRFIPRTEVEKLGAQAVKAYDAIGGAARVIAAMQKPDTLGFLIREFSDAYRSAA